MLGVREDKRIMQDFSNPAEGYNSAGKLSERLGSQTLLWLTYCANSERVVNFQGPVPSTIKWESHPPLIEKIK